MRGASASEQLLARHPEWRLRVLVVWEPILVTDWTPPGSSVLARISDPRARQFWDPHHLVSNALKVSAQRQAGQPKPNFHRSFYWDQALVYSPASRWQSAPPPSFWSGPVYLVIPPLEQALSAQ